MKKIKDLPENTIMSNVKIKTPTGIIGWWASQWNKGVWIHKDGNPENQVTPIFVEDLRETLEWEVIETRR